MMHLPDTLPIFPLDGALLLPRGNLPLNIFEPRYIEMVDYALKNDRMIGMVQTGAAGAAEKIVKSNEEHAKPVCSIGCAGRITLFSETEDGRYVITLTGVSRYRIKSELSSIHKFRLAEVEWDDYKGDFLPLETEGVDREAILSTLKKYLNANDLETDWDGILKADSESLINALSMMSPFGSREKQALLEANSLKERSDLLIAMTEINLQQNSAEDSNQLQ